MIADNLAEIDALAAELAEWSPALTMTLNMAGKAWCHFRTMLAEGRPLDDGEADGLDSATGCAIQALEKFAELAGKMSSAIDAASAALETQIVPHGETIQ